MIKSMTGFASVTREDERATLGVTIRALNHRHLDVQLRTPQSLAALEGEMRALIARETVSAEPLKSTRTSAGHLKRRSIGRAPGIWSAGR